MFSDRDSPLRIAWKYHKGFTVEGPELPSSTRDLWQDLGLETIVRAMSGGDSLLWGTVTYAMLSPLKSAGEIGYRQDVLKDCLAHPGVVGEMFSVAVDAVIQEHQLHRPRDGSPRIVMARAAEVLEIFLGKLRRLRQIADDHAGSFTSVGMSTLTSMLRDELDDEYFGRLDEHLKRLTSKEGQLVSATLGRGLLGTQYTLRSPGGNKRTWRQRIGMEPRDSYYFEIHPRDVTGGQHLSGVNDRGIKLAAAALEQSADHILGFFRLLCTELGFYVGCLNLSRELVTSEVPTCMPAPLSSSSMSLLYDGIYDVALACGEHPPIVGNGADANGKSLVMITGANSGGKSTLLRAIGQAQLMMQAGMFAGARNFRANLATGVFTHFTREEDPTMTSGKFDEEVSRMSEIADQICPGCVILFNESFAATNEREGAEIARQVIRALVEAGVKVLFVAHQFTLADTLWREHLETALFLRAERASDGRRTFKVTEGEPLPTSFGQDLYRRIGGFTDKGTAAGMLVSNSGEGPA